MFKRRRISDLLEQLDRIPVPEAELEALEREVMAEITALWQTDDVRSARPTVRDEIRMALDYYESSLFDTLPVLYAEIAAALAAEYRARAAPAAGRAAAAGALWLVDRRRPRRQSVCDAGGHARGAGDGARSAAGALPRDGCRMSSSRLASSTQQVPVSAELRAAAGSVSGADARRRARRRLRSGSRIE